MTTDEFISKLGANGKPRQQGGGWMACCPAHADKSPSLSVSTGHDGRVLLKCFAGCSVDAICASANLTTSDLFNGEPKRNGNSAAAKIVATYPYQDAEGRVLFEAVRSEPKTFKQRRPDIDQPGEWIWNLQGVETVLFRLPEVLRDVKRGLPVLIAEGEKDVLALVKHGFSATCNPMGAGKWKDRFSDSLAGADCVLIPDDDEPGRKHVEQVATSLHGKAARVRVVKLPSTLNEHRVKDASDLFAAGGDPAALIALIDSAPDWQPVQIAPTVQTEAGIDADGHPLNQPASVPTPEPDHFKSDVGYADAFVRRHADSIRFVADEKQWLVFKDETGWQRDDSGRVKALFADYARELYRGAVVKALDTDPDTGKRIIASMAALGNLKRISAALALAECNPEIVAHAKQLDADPFLVGVKNGVVDLRDGSFQSHARQHLVTRRLATRFDAPATAPTWERFLAEVQPDPAMRQFLQRWAGYCLTGETRDHVLPFHYGTGANGKGTFLEQVLLKLQADYGAKLTDSLVYASERGHVPHLEIANLCGRRFALGEESAASGKLNEALLKAMTGGDSVKGRFHYANHIEYFPSYKVALVGNHKPRIEGKDDGFWRRFLLVDWPVQIPPEQRDTLLKDRLAAELPGILNWCIEGARQWLASGLTPPASCLVATDDFRRASDSLNDFITDHFAPDPASHCTKADVFSEYQRWTREQGIDRPMSKRGLGFQLANRGWQEFRFGKKRTQCWSCWTVKTTFEE